MTISLIDNFVLHGIPDYMMILLLVKYLVIYDRPGIIRGVVVGDFLKADDGKL